MADPSHQAVEVPSTPPTNGSDNEKMDVLHDQLSRQSTLDASDDGIPKDKETMGLLHDLLGQENHGAPKKVVSY